MLNKIKNWDHWYNSILDICEITDIDDVLIGHDTISVQMNKETDKAFSERIVYWKIVNKYIIDSIRFSLKSEELAHIADVSDVYQMIQRLRN